jgi:hypothetical protein
MPKPPDSSSHNSWPPENLIQAFHSTVVMPNGTEVK